MSIMAQINFYINVIKITKTGELANELLEIVKFRLTWTGWNG